MKNLRGVESLIRERDIHQWRDVQFSINASSTTRMGLSFAFPSNVALDLLELGDLVDELDGIRAFLGGIVSME